MPDTSHRTSASAATAHDVAPASRVLRQFRVVFNAVKTHFRQVEKVAGVGGAQVWALSVVEARPGIGVSELGRVMDVHQSTASNLVKPLLERGLLTTARGGHDRRAVALHLSESGRRLLAQAPAPFAGVLPDALAGLDAATLARLEQDLGKLIAALAAGDDGAGTPLADL